MSLKRNIILFNRLLLVIFFSMMLFGCNNSASERGWIQRNTPFSQQNLECKNDENSALRQILSYKTDTLVRSFIEYWQTGQENKVFRSDTSGFTQSHKFVLFGLKPECNYSYRIVNTDNKYFSMSPVSTFKTKFLPIWLDAYYTHKEDAFRIDGKMLISNRKDPGMIVLLDSDGNIEWYNAFTKFLKTAYYTHNNTFLFILSDPGYKTTYGNHLLEMNMKGDTLLNFCKDSSGFSKTFHHEALLDNSGNVIVLTAENKKIDLSSVGGNKSDSITADGIQVFSREGKKIWEWTVFDVEDPLKDTGILKNKADWLHANSMCFDTDGNFLISFYYINQIWKIDSKTGKLIWKLGENGDFPLGPEALFSGQHSIHINMDGNLMMFDNGIKTKKSRALSFTINEQQKIARVVINAPLPEALYSEKMGSAYLLSKNTILQCSTNKEMLAATDLEGKILWQVKLGGLTYRAQFIPGKAKE